MRYGQDPIALEAAEQAALAAIKTQHGLHWHLWLDSAFDAADGSPPAQGYDGVNAWAVDELQTLHHLAPWVMPLYAPGDSAEQVLARLRPWLEHAGARPMLSLWASSYDAQHLARHMRTWGDARDAEGESLLLRLADCRSVAVLARVLTPAQWQGLTQPLAAWLIVDREGHWQAMPLAGEQDRNAETPPAQPPMTLTDVQVQAMAEAAEPDALLNHMATHDGAQLPKSATPSWAHAFSVSVLSLADQHEVGNLEDKLSLLRAAWFTQGKVLDEHGLMELLALKEYTKGQLGHAILERGLLG